MPSGPYLGCSTSASSIQQSPVHTAEGVSSSSINSPCHCQTRAFFGRLDHQTYFKSLRVDQHHLRLAVLDRLLKAWLDEAALVEGLLPQSMRVRGAATPHTWFWDGVEHVDPAKEANAQATRLTNHTTTLAHEYARQGRDWEDELRQRAKELALMAELGLPVAPAAQQESAPGRDEEQETEAHAV